MIDRRVNMDRNRSKRRKVARAFIVFYALLIIIIIIISIAASAELTRPGGATCSVVCRNIIQRVGEITVVKCEKRRYSDALEQYIFQYVSSVRTQIWRIKCRP